MDQWLTKIADDTSNDSKLVKMRRAKPADLVDACWTRDEHPQRIVERQMPTSGRCNELYPANSFPRGVAGSPLAADVIKCQLKPIVGVRLQGDVHGRRNGAAEADLPGRRVRLVEARRRAAADGRHLAVPAGGAAEYGDAVGNTLWTGGSNKKGRVRKDPPYVPGRPEGRPLRSLLRTSTYFFHFSTFQLFNFERGATRARA